MAGDYDRERAAAVVAVRRAAEACRGVQRRLVSPETLRKSDRTPVTVADFASQAVVAATLAERLPGDALVAEEDAGPLRGEDAAAMLRQVARHAGRALGCPLGEAEALEAIDRGRADATGSRYWALDPIDGTKGFLRREQYAVALALIEKGRIVLGVLGCPNLDPDGTLFAAVRGQGTTVQPIWPDAGPTPVRVGAVTDPAAARFCESVESGHSDHGAAARIAARMGITAEPLRMDSQCKYGAVARGDASIYLRLPTVADYREWIWDHAAGAICVEEAGGRVTDVDGRALDFTRGRRLDANRGVVATNGHLHDAVLEAVADVIG